MTTRIKTGAFVLAGLVVSLLLATVVSQFASPDPDGLDSVTLDGCTVDAEGEITGGDCIAKHAADHEIGGPLADYGVAGLDPTLGTALSGVLGVLVVFAVGAALFWAVRRRRPAVETGSDDD